MASYKIIGGDHREYGPVSAEEVRRWIADGRLNAQSPARLEETTEWKTLGDIPEFSDAKRLRPITPPPPVGAALVQPTDWREQILAREPKLGFGECLHSSFSFLAANAGFVIPAVFIAWLIDLLLIFLPLIGGILHLLFSGVVMGGLYLACLRRMRGEPAKVGDMFDGFRRNFVQLMLAGAISSLLTQVGFLFCLLPGFYLFVAWTFVLPLVVDKRLEFWSAMELSRRVVARVWFPMWLLLTLVFVPFIVLQIAGGVQMLGFVRASLQEANFDMAQWLPRLSQLAPGFVKQFSFWVLVTQAAWLLCQFFAVGALMRAYENLFGERNA